MTRDFRCWLCGFLIAGTVTVVSGLLLGSINGYHLDASLFASLVVACPVSLLGSYVGWCYAQVRAFGGLRGLRFGILDLILVVVIIACCTGFPAMVARLLSSEVPPNVFRIGGSLYGLLASIAYLLGKMARRAKLTDNSAIHQYRRGVVTIVTQPGHWDAST